MKRILEPESMDSLEEAIPYDALVSDKQGDILDECFVLSILNMGVTEGKILDIGTGTGRIPIKIAKKCPQYLITAIDLSKNMLKVANENKRRYGLEDYIEFQYGDAKKMFFDDDYFDIVISHVTFHHIANPVPALKEANRVLKPGGALIVRDLKRPINKLLVKLFITIFGSQFDKIQKKLFRDSLMAGFTKKEFHAFAEQAGITDYKITQHFITHIGIEKKAMNYKKPKCAYELPSGNDLKIKMMIKHYISR